MKRELFSGAERSRQRKAAFLLFATMFFAAIGTYYGVTQAQAYESIKYPTVGEWNAEEGYMFNPEGGPYVTVRQFHNKETRETYTVSIDIDRSIDLCGAAPNTPSCLAVKDVAETFGLDTKEAEDLSRKVVIFPGENPPEEVCGNDNAVGCVGYGKDVQKRHNSDWIFAAEGPLNESTGAQSILAHEIFHILSPRYETEGKPLEVTLLHDSIVEQGCIRWSADSAEVCQAGEGQKGTDCQVSPYAELEAVIASRVHMIGKDPQCGEVDYTKDHWQCSGGYPGIYNFEAGDDGSYLSRNAVYSNINSAVEYFLANHTEFKQWIKLKKDGKIMEAETLLVKAMGREEELQELQLQTFSMLNEALVFYTDPDAVTSNLTIFYDQPVSEVCK